MELANGGFKIIKINDLITLQDLKIGENQNFEIQFKSSKDILEPVNLQIAQYANSSFKLICVINNSLELNLDLKILGNHTSSEIYNLVDLTANKKVKLNQNIIASFAHNQAQHITKCVLDQSSHASIKHLVKAKSSTKNLSLNQKIQALVLSSTAKVEMQPILQIESEDVQCKHGSTQGFLDTNAIFYMQARGLSPDICKGLLVVAFKAEILSKTTQ